MSTTFTIKKPRPLAGGGGRGPIDRRDFGGGGGGGRGDGAPNFGERLRRYRLGIAIALVAVVTVFVAFTVTFLLRENVGTWDASTGTYIRDWHPTWLPMDLLLFNTVLLVLSSATLEKARRQAAEYVILEPLRSIPGIDTGFAYRIPWLGVSTILGISFLGGQALAWRATLARGTSISLSPGSSFFYILTGAHAVHLFGGLLALLYACAATTVLRRPPETRRIVVDVTAWYWHVMAGLWLYILVLLALGN